MNKIRIVEPGWETFTGDMGGATFVNGESTEPLPQLQVDRIGASIRIELEDGRQGGIQERLVSQKGVEAPELVGLERATEADLAGSPEPVAPEVPAPVFHTEAELEGIAEEKGIAGLRLIGTPLGVKGRSIPELIREILDVEKKIKAQMAEEPVIAPAPVVEDVVTEEPAAPADAPSEV